MKIFKHFKGGLYGVIAECAQHTETLEGFVIYKDIKSGAVWARPYDEFHGYINGVKRFEFAREVKEDE